jgi:single-strand DNA-binding protein
MNSVSLIGHLTRDPEPVDSKSGNEICNLRVAVDRRGQDGAIYTDVRTFGKQASVCAEHLEKGRQVAITGRLELDEWEAEGGAKRSRIYVIADRVDFLSGGGNGGGGGGGSRGGGAGGNRGGGRGRGGGGSGGGGGGGNSGRGSWRRDD